MVNSDLTPHCLSEIVIIKDKLLVLLLSIGCKLHARLLVLTDSLLKEISLSLE